jgi:hypothetical protein
VYSETGSVRFHALVIVEKCGQYILNHARVRFLPTTASASLIPVVPDFLWRLPLNSGYGLVSAVQPQGSGIVGKHVHAILEATPPNVKGLFRKDPHRPSSSYLNLCLCIATPTLPGSWGNLPRSPSSPNNAPGDLPCSSTPPWPASMTVSLGQRHTSVPLSVCLPPMTRREFA